MGKPVRSVGIQSGVLVNITQVPLTVEVVAWVVGSIAQASALDGTLTHLGLSSQSLWIDLASLLGITGNHTETRREGLKSFASVGFIGGATVLIVDEETTIGHLLELAGDGIFEVQSRSPVSAKILGDLARSARGCTEFIVGPLKKSGSGRVKQGALKQGRTGSWRYHYRHGNCANAD